MKKRIGLACCAVGGAMIVGFYDLGFYDRQSLIMKTAEIIRIYFFKNWDTSAWAGLVVVTFIGFFLGFVRKPKAMWPATEIGLGVVAFIATMMSPLKQESISKHAHDFIRTTIAFADEKKISNPSDRKIALMLEDSASTTYNVQIREGKSGKILKTTTANSTTPVEIDATSSEGDIYVYVEAEGKKWTKFRIEPNDQNKFITIKPGQSKIPMFFQRFIGPAEPAGLTATSIKSSIEK